MLKDINQKDIRLLWSLREYGCLFLCFAQQSPLIFEGNEGCQALNYLWEKAISKGVINSVYDLIDHTRLAQDFFALNVEYDEIHHDSDEPIPEEVAFVFGRFVWKQGHFVIINKNKEVIFDSLVDSYSVKNGVLQSMRWYYAKKDPIDL